MTSPTNAPARLTVTARSYPDSLPIDRDFYARILGERMDRGAGEERVPVLTKAELLAAADLLDELAGVYRDEPLGALSRTIAVKIFDGLSI